MKSKKFKKIKTAIHWGKKTHKKIRHTAPYRIGVTAIASGVIVSSVFVITSALAQEGVITPVKEMLPNFSQFYSGQQPPQPMPPTGEIPKCNRCQHPTPNGTCENQPFGAPDPSNSCANGEFCDGQGNCTVKKEGFQPNCPAGADCGFRPDTNGDGQVCAPGTDCKSQNNQNRPWMGNEGKKDCAPGTDCSFQPNQGDMGKNDMRRGPSEEEMQKMNQQRLEMMKKDMSRFIKEMDRVKKNVASFEKKGVAISAELKEALSKVDAVSETIKNSQDPEELQDTMSDFQDSMMVIQEWMPKLPRLAQLPKILKQADKEIAKAEKAYKNDKSRATRAKLDLDVILSDFFTNIEQQKTLLTEIKELAKTDSDEAFDRLTNEFFADMDNVWESERVIQISFNFRRGMTQISKEIKEAEKTIKRLGQKKIDTTELKELLATTKEQAEETKELINAKPMDFEAAVDSLDNLMNSKQDFMDKVQELTGENYYQPQFDPKANGMDFQMNIPKGFDFGINREPNKQNNEPINTDKAKN